MMQETSAKFTHYSSPPESTMYDKLKALAEEISEGIFNLSGAETSRIDIQRDIDSIADVSSREKSPEVVLNIMLFRKYADVANQLKDANKNRNEVAGLLAELPSFETDESQLVGWSAFGEKIFWLRLASSILAFISFVVMATAPNISNGYYNPGKYFLYGCQTGNVTQGSFDYRPYQVILAFGVIVWFYNAVFATYYLLPTDVNKRKYIPGFAALLAKCMSREHADEYAHNGALFCKSFSKFIESLMDGLMLALCGFVSIIASIVLERSERFTFDYVNSFGQYSKSKVYFTIGSFYATFVHSSPQCLSDNEDPGPKIRASLAMMYLTLFILTLSFMVSYTAFRKELGSGAHAYFQSNPLGGSGSSAVGDDEESVVFTALPNHDTSMHNNSNNGNYNGDGNNDRSMSV